MKAFIVSITILAMTNWVGAKQTRREIVNSTTPAEDSKPNSNAVPAEYAITGQFDRILIVRLKYQTDLLGGLQEAVKTNHIRNAVILSGIGSVRGYSVHSVSNRTFPSKDTFVKDPTAPADLVSVNGYVVDGRVHAHVTLANADKAFGGHLEPGTEVFTFAIVTIGVLNDKADLSRVDDKTYR
ncbi:MAG TPA: PPC domain-containing DNA-binding protein [Verrucomicrobiae bacterium]|nr:PPC domain-containing DNA-binding protein [Verrucomicrobiae bacterium]